MGQESRRNDLAVSNEIFDKPARKLGSRVLSPQDTEFYRLLAQYQYLQPRHFQHLCGRNIVSLRRRLRQLYEVGDLNRMCLPAERTVPVIGPPDQYVYSLTQRGIHVARHYGFADEHHRYNDEKSNILLPHDLEISTFHATLELALRNHASHRLNFWEQRRSRLLDSVRASGEHLSVNPDALFTLEDLSRPQGKNRIAYFLEIVRARESEYRSRSGSVAGESNFLRKMRAFEEYYRQAGARNRWGFTNFRVVTVIPTEQRLLNLCRKLREANLAFKRFWFTTADRYALEQPAGILEKIFATSHDFDSGERYRFTDEA